MRKKRTGFVVLGILLIIFAMAIFSFVWYYLSKNENNNEQTIPESKSVQITFDLGYGVTVTNDLTEGDVVLESMAPQLSTNILGCGLSGWYSDKDCTIEYIFNNPITENITIYAKTVYVETDWISYDDSTSTYKVVAGTSTLPSELIIPNLYDDGTHGEAEITTISNSAFKQNTDITSVTIPTSVQDIEEAVFAGCANLAKVTFAEGIELDIIPLDSFANCTSLREINIPTSVTAIYDEAFANCESLTNITIPNNIVEIGINVFSGCTSLTNITFEDIYTWCKTSNSDYTGGEVIDVSDATQNATWLVSTSGYYDYYWYKVSYNLPSDWLSWNETTSSYQVVKGTTTLPTILNIPSVYDDGTHGKANVTGIQDGYRESLWAEGAFSSTNLTSVTIPKTITKLGDEAFSFCSNLTSVIFAEDSQLTEIGMYTFWKSKSLISIVIPSSVETICEGAFYECSALTSVIFEKNSQLRTIGYDAFHSCKNLTSITFAENSQLTTIGDAAFSGTGLTSITIPSSVTSISTSSFPRKVLSNIVVEEGNTVYDSRDNCNAIIETSTNTLIIGCKTTIIPDSVITIGDSAFGGCTNLTSITIPSSVTKIGDSAFSGCTSLTSITFEDTSTWYKTLSDSYIDGEIVDVTNATQNATWLVSTSGYYDYYWYKE